MNESFFDAYGALADIGVDPTEQAGRLPSQARAERLIVADIARKLALTPDARLLEIGCGPGNLLIPLSFAVANAVGVDHPSIIARARARFEAANLAWIGGAFPSVKVEGPFDAILMYSVLQYQPDMHAAIGFCESAVALLPEGGRLLVGDLPNVDRKARFRDSPAGRAFDAEWRRQQASAPPPSDHASVFAGRKSLGGFSDADVLRIVAHFRASGLHAYVLPQPPDLPFGHTQIGRAHV